MTDDEPCVPFTGHAELPDGVRVRTDVTEHAAELVIGPVTFTMSREAFGSVCFAIATGGIQAGVTSETELDFYHRDWYRANPREKAKGPSR